MPTWFELTELACGPLYFFDRTTEVREYFYWFYIYFLSLFPIYIYIYIISRNHQDIKVKVGKTTCMCIFLPENVLYFIHFTEYLHRCRVVRVLDMCQLTCSP